MMTPSTDEALIERYLAGDKECFTQLLGRHRSVVKAYFYRMTTHQEDAEDLTQELWARVHQKLSSFEGRSSFRTWLFTLATRLAVDHYRARQRYPENAQDLAKAFAMANPEVEATFEEVARDNPQERYELREHIDFCMTCILKTLPLEQQVAVLLCEIYGFSNAETAQIMDKTLGVTKHLLHAARSTMDRIFEHRCALINKEGICNQCSELNGVFNGQWENQAIIARLDLVQATGDIDRSRLLPLRLALVKEIDPLRSSGPQIQDAIMDAVRRAVPLSHLRNSDA